VSVWARSDSVAGPINWILGNAKQFRFGFGHGQVYFWIQEEGLGSTNLISGGSVSAGNWYHIVGTYDGTYQKLYVNSSLAASEAPGLGVLDNGHDNFTIGKACKSSSGFFDGDIDEVRIFSKALSASEVLALYDEPELGQADLLPQYDTGASKQDNLTKLDNGPTDKNVPIGQITASGNLNDIVSVIFITDGSTDLPDGQNQITATQSLDGKTSENSQPLTIEIDITQFRMIYRTPTREQTTVVDYMGFRFNETFDSQTLNKTDIDLRTPNDDPVAIDFAVSMWDGPRSFAAFFDCQVLAGDYAVTARNIADLACNVVDSYHRDPAFSTLPDLSWVNIDLRIDFSGVIALVSMGASKPASNMRVKTSQ